MSSSIKTKVLILSDTHGLRFGIDRKPLASADVAIHCGDLTDGSQLREFKETIELLKEIDAPVKIAIAGNHDFSLDDKVLEGKIAEGSRLAEEDLQTMIKKEYGDYGVAKQQLIEARDQGIIFLEEGSHAICLENGGLLRLYASPYTPATGDSQDWGFQYHGSHDFTIRKGTDIVVTMKYGSLEDKKAREVVIEQYRSQRCCTSIHYNHGDKSPASGKTLFINASLMGGEGLCQYPWLVDIDLDMCEDATTDAPEVRYHQTALVTSEEQSRAHKRKIDGTLGREENVKKSKLHVDRNPSK